MNSIINYVILEKLKYSRLNSNKLIKFKKFINIEQIFNLSKQFYNYRYSQYNHYFYYLRPMSINYDNHKLRFDVINNQPFFTESNSNSILKNKLITWHYPI